MSILELFMKDHVTLKTGVIMLKIQIYITGIKYILKYLYKIFHNIIVLRPKRKKAERIPGAMTRWNKTTDSYGCFHIDRKHSPTKNVIYFFWTSLMNLLSFTKRKHGTSDKIWALHHIASATGVTQNLDAVALKAQKAVLSTSVKTPK